MTLAKDFIGIGMPAGFSNMEGLNPAVAVTAAGASAATATALLLSQDFVLMTATGADGVRLPAGTLQLQPQMIVNVTAASNGTVYPPTGGNFAGGATDAGIVVPGRKTIICWRYSATGWAYNLSA
jgi:hypothetical protein